MGEPGCEPRFGEAVELPKPEGEAGRCCLFTDSALCTNDTGIGLPSTDGDGDVIIGVGTAETGCEAI